LRDALAAALKDGKPVPGFALAVLAAYFPLYSLEGAEALPGKSWPEPVAALLTQQIREPQAERELRASIQRLTPIEDEVSRAVQQQYEENPFPRWVKLARPGRASTLNRALREMFPLSGFVEIEKEDGVEFLIAGCGTGQQSIERAQAFAGVKFTAIDLSMASLCYARRKTHELGIANIDYAQADIVKLGSIGRTFDAVESSGVLVAIGDPWGAWRTLISLLRPGGVMSIGLYSEVARRNIVAAQKYLAGRGYRANDEDMRRGRQDIMALDDGSPVKWVTNAGDFFSMSNCRDMLFHAQEHRFALPRIKDFLTENGLVFLGFALDEGLFKRYAERFPGDPARTNLEHWHDLEQENPDTFISMYQFWVQKPRAVPTSTEAHGRA
jgi:SAM-dependent methyltransferase